MTINKIKSQEELAKIVSDLKKQGKKVITTNGTFDMTHAGHVCSLENIKKHGDVLVVGVNSDSSVKRYKSDKRPFIGENERIRMIASLNVVDYVTMFTENDPCALLEKLKPSLHAKGKDWENKTCPEKEVVERNGGKMIFVDSGSPITTTSIIQKILDVMKEEINN
jgi:glycerol-3-phosphate cytidylyltransferase